jgi:hypothetical protein
MATPYYHVDVQYSVLPDINIECVCNAYQLMPVSMVASGLISAVNAIFPSVTPYLGPDDSRWPESTRIDLVA